MRDIIQTEKVGDAHEATIFQEFFRQMLVVSVLC